MAIALVQQAQNTDGVSTDTLFTITLSSTPTNGNFLVLTYGSATQNDIVSISGGGVSWSAVAGAKDVTGNRSNEIWFGLNVSSGGTVITVTLTSAIGSGNAVGANVSEWSGILTNGAVDQSAHNGGTSTAPSTGTTGTTSQGDELVIAGLKQDGTSAPTGGPTGGFTALTRSSTGALGALEPAYLIVSSTGTQTTSWTLGASQKWVSGIATFRGAGAEAGDPELKEGRAMAFGMP